MTKKAPKARDEEHALQHTNDEANVRACLDAVIGEQVIHALGRPPGLRSVQVRHLWQDRHRVNVLVGDDATAVNVGHSFFLTVGGDGNILTSNPRITRMY